MTAFVVENGHRIFDDLRDDDTYVVGDRHRSVGALDLEWTGSSWSPVCPIDGVAETHNGSGRLSCPTCKRTHNELSDLVRS